MLAFGVFGHPLTIRAVSVTHNGPTAATTEGSGGLVNVMVAIYGQERILVWLPVHPRLVVTQVTGDDPVHLVRIFIKGVHPEANLTGIAKPPSPGVLSGLKS